MKRIITILAFGSLLIVNSSSAADVYKIDPVHSSIGFSVTHLMVSQVTGQFDKFEGTISYDPGAVLDSKASAAVEVASVNTRDAKRDAHLRSADFFDADKFPAIKFVSKTITPSFIVGDLTIKDVTKEVNIPITILGPVKTPGGAMVIGITGSFKINRQDYNVKWNKTLDQGGVMVSDDVTINVNIEADKAAAAK
jgi:polyisoprenoid-binding protein YceI